MNPNIARLQTALNIRADGIRGDQTDRAILRAADDGLLTVVAAPAPAVPSAPTSPVRWPRRADVANHFGPAGGADCTAGSVVLPFPVLIAWDTSQRISRFSCHRLVAAALTRIYAEAARHYGEARFRELRLDRWGGCYNYRSVRGGSNLSMHAYGIAVDVDPERNGLTMGRDKATLDGLEYEPFWKLVEREGALSLGRLRNFDWMHFEFTAGA